MSAQDTQEQDTERASHSDGGSPSSPEEKLEPDDGQKEKAAEMMTAYEDRPTLVLPGTGGAVSGTAVNDWLDDDGNPKGAGDDDELAEKGRAAFDQAAEDRQDVRDSEDASDSEGAEHDRDHSMDSERAKSARASKDSEDNDPEAFEKQAEKDKEFNATVIKETKERWNAAK